MSCSYITTAPTPCHHSHLYLWRGGVTPTLPKEGLVTCKRSSTPNVPPTSATLGWVNSSSNSCVPAPTAIVVMMQEGLGTRKVVWEWFLLLLLLFFEEKSQGPFTSWGTSQPMTPWRPLLCGIFHWRRRQSTQQRTRGSHLEILSIDVTGSSWKLGGSPNWLSNESKKCTPPYTM